MNQLFGEVMRMPQILQPLQKANKITQIQLTDPSVILTLDGRSNPARYIPGPVEEPVPDFIIRMPTDVLHNVWLGRASLTEAYFAGKIKLAKGSALSALGLWNNLSGLFSEVGKIYPRILKQHSLAV
jgi:putative sterol carrier protein